MKVAYKHLIDCIESKPTVSEISEKLFQLGHEHEIENDIFDMEFTPNRGDCLSTNGILRDLSVFYDINFNGRELYEEEIQPLVIDFANNAQKECPHIAFLKIEVEEEILNYKGPLQEYFLTLQANKNNFFTDISNYISYETGQPTHCYDAASLDQRISLKKLDGNFIFKTLLDKEIKLTGKNLVFMSGEEIINLAGVVGGKASSCSKDTRSVIIECAYFNPEEIIGKSIKYGIQSEAAHKFERNVDPMCHEKVLRRFISIVNSHAVIKNVELFKKSYTEEINVSIDFNLNAINKIIGTCISENEYKDYLLKLGFCISNNKILVPSYRSDINTQNDLAEEIARSIGYNKIPTNEIKILNSLHIKSEKIDYKIKGFLIDHGFYEVINSPFVPKSNNESIKVDNPLDSNREFLRTDLKKSLIDNLLYNERRQKDSVKLFEISDIYTQGEKSKKKMLGIIASGRIGRNYEDFSKEINNNYLESILKELMPEISFNPENISRNELDSKSKNTVSYLEIELDKFSSKIVDYQPFCKPPSTFIKYKPISEFPSSTRDISFSVKDPSRLNLLEESILNYKHDLLKEVFIFDYYINEEDARNKNWFQIYFSIKHHHHHRYGSKQSCRCCCKQSSCY